MNETFKNKVIDKLAGEWVEKIDGKWTFAGVLLEYGDIVGEQWKAERTMDPYITDYLKYVLPFVKEKALEEYTREDFDAVLEQLPILKANEGLAFNEEKNRHICHIIKRVLEVAEKKDICPDILWGTNYGVSERSTEETLASKEHVKHRKSLTPEEELNIAHEILEDPAQGGQLFGLALMFCEGLRNGEACAARFRDVRPFKCDKTRSALWVYKSVVSGTNQEQEGGKTSNVSRIVPIPQRLLKLLMERRAWLTEKVLNGEIEIDNRLMVDITDGASEEERAEAYVDGLPIACKDNKYATLCAASDLTTAGRVLLKKVYVKQEMLSLIDRDIRKPGRTEEGIEEKDPTVYLFRRNLGTHLYLLGLNDNEIQYVIGHDIEDPDDERNFYRNEERLYPIALKMEERPIVNETETIRKVHVTGNSFVEKSISKKELHIPVSNDSGRIRILLNQCETGPNLKIGIEADGVEVTGEYEQYENCSEHGSTLNITEQYQRTYRKRAKRLNEINQKNALEQEDDLAEE